MRKWNLKTAGRILMAALAIFATIQITPTHVKAATENADTIYVAGKEGAGDLELGSGHGFGTNVEWIYNDGYTALTNGQSVVPGSLSGINSGSQATFTYGTESSMLALDSYKTTGGAGYKSGNNLYGIYYEGNLVIDVRGTSKLSATWSDTLADTYGIYVNGDLTIIGKGRLSIDVQVSDSSAATGKAYGIFCTGKLTIADNVKLTVTAGPSEQQNMGIYCYGYEQVDGTVMAQGGDTNNSYSYGMLSYSRSDMSTPINISGGLLSAKGGNTNTVDGISFGILFNGTLTLSGGTVIGTGGEGRNSKGIALGRTGEITGGFLNGKSGVGYYSAGIQLNRNLTLPEGSTATIWGEGAFANESGTDQEIAEIYSNKGIDFSSSSGQITVEGGLLRADGGPAGAATYAISYGLVVSDLIVSGQGSVQASSASDKGSALAVSFNIVCSGNGSIEAHGGDGSGIKCLKKIEMNGGNVTADGKTAIEASGITMTDGVLNANGTVTGIVGDNYYPLTVEGGELTAMGSGRAIGGFKGITANIMEGGYDASGSDFDEAEEYVDDWKYAHLGGYKVYFHANGHGTAPAEQAVWPGDMVEEPGNPAEEGWTFGGWYANEACTGDVYDFEDSVYGELHLYAAWTEGVRASVAMGYAKAALDGKIGLAFFVELPEWIQEDEGAYAILTQCGEEKMIYVSDIVAGGVNYDGLYRVPIYMPAAYYRENVNMRFYDGLGKVAPLMGRSSHTDLTGSGVNYTLEKYVRTMKNSDVDRTKKLGIAMDDYCTAAQIYFEHPTEGVTLTLSSAVAGVTQADLSAYKSVRTGEISSRIEGFSLNGSFESDCALKIGVIFKGDGKKKSGINYFIQTEEGGELIPTTLRGSKSSGYYLVARNIPAAYLGKNYTFVIEDTVTGQTCSIACSLFTYVRASAFNATMSTDFQNLAKALYLYGTAAQQYFDEEAAMFGGTRKQ